MISSSASTLVHHWKQLPISLLPPVDKREIEAFERRYSTTLPGAIRDYFLAVNGFGAPNDQDPNGFSFWPLARVCLTSELDQGRWSAPNAGNCFLFADYLSLSWGYAFQVTAETSEARVCIVGTADRLPIWIASRFSEFVNLYINDDDKLYPVRRTT
jgi:hypothetical protein